MKGTDPYKRSKGQAPDAYEYAENDEAYDEAYADGYGSAYGARRFNRNLRSKRKEGVYRRNYWLTWVVALSLALIVALVVPTYVFTIEPVEGDSMLPTLRSGERLLISKLTYSFRKPNRFDVVVCRYPGREELFVKRVIGLENETIEIRGGEILIDGRQLQNDAPFASFELRDMPPVEIPRGHVFVIGDNHASSIDSRDPKVGCIPYNLLVGHTSTVIYPGIRFFQ